jgi:hypothetical protein
MLFAVAAAASSSDTNINDQSNKVNIFFTFITKNTIDLNIIMIRLTYIIIKKYNSDKYSMNNTACGYLE